MGSTVPRYGWRVFEDYREQFSAPRTGSEATLAASLRRHFPQHHVTCTEVMSIIKFAEAGNASCKLVLEDETCDFARTYRWSRPRIDTPELGDHIFFGRYEYSWKGCNFIVFQLRFPLLFGGERQRMFVLAPRDQGEIVDGRHSLTEQLVLEAGKWNRLEQDTVWVYDKSEWTKSSDLWKAVQASSWDDVIMDPKAKQDLIDDVVGFFDSKDLYQEFTVPWKRGIILHGSPGNGKTLTIKALMAALSKRPENVPTLYIKSLKSDRGPQYSLDTVFSRARCLAPCLLIFEDLDSLITEKVRSYFLNEVDGIEGGDYGMLIVGTTNHLAKLDPAIAQRPSRFDRKYHFASPDFDSRVAYCQHWRRRLANNKRVQFTERMCDIVAELTEGFTFATMNELFTAAMLRFVRGGDEVEEDDPVAGAAGLTKPTRSLPGVKIPLDLQKNALLQVFVQQSKILRREMDAAETKKPSEVENKDGETAHEDDKSADSDDDSDKPKGRVIHIHRYYD